MSELWTLEDIRKLGEYYPKCTRKELLVLFPQKDLNAIVLKARHLKLKKLPETLSRVRNTFAGKRHKQETKEKIRKANQDRKFSPETLLKMSEAHKGKRGLCGISNPAKRPEVRAKISQGRIGVKYSDDFRQKIKERTTGAKNPFYGKRHSRETKLMISSLRKGQHNSPRTEFTSEGMQGKCADPNEIERRRVTCRKLWQTKEYREKTISGMIKALAKRPNRLEQEVIRILQDNFPNEWKYTGNGKAVFGSLFPDFINVNGKKKVIEVFGSYWHTGKAVKGRAGRTESGKIKGYRDLGFECLVLWDKDIKHEEKVTQAVKSFLEA